MKKSITPRRLPPVLTCGLALLLAPPLLRGASFEELSRQIGELGRQVFELQASIREREEALERDFKAGTHDSEAMKATRARIARLQQELLEAQVQLRKEFEELPQLRAELAEIKRVRQASNELEKRGRALLQERATLFKRPPATAPATPQATEPPGEPAMETAAAPAAGAPAAGEE